MKKTSILMATLLLGGLTASTAQALISFFDFDIGGLGANTAATEAYMTGIYGEPVQLSANDGIVLGELTTDFNGSATLGFNGNVITGLSMDFRVLLESGSVDFGINVFNGATWVDNFFTKNYAFAFNETDETGFIDLSGLGITAFRFHDKGIFQTSIDNLYVYDNRSSGEVPEPGSIAIWALGMGLASMSVGRRRRKRS